MRRGLVEDSLDSEDEKRGEVEPDPKEKPKPSVGARVRHDRTRTHILKPSIARKLELRGHFSGGLTGRTGSKTFAKNLNPVNIDLSLDTDSDEESSNSNNGVPVERKKSVKPVSRAGSVPIIQSRQRKGRKPGKVLKKGRKAEVGRTIRKGRKAGGKPKPVENERRPKRTRQRPSNEDIRQRPAKRQKRSSKRQKQRRPVKRPKPSQRSDLLDCDIDDLEDLTEILCSDPGGIEDQPMNRPRQERNMRVEHAPPSTSAQPVEDSSSAPDLSKQSRRVRFADGEDDEKDYEDPEDETTQRRRKEIRRHQGADADHESSSNEAKPTQRRSHAKRRRSPEPDRGVYSDEKTSGPDLRITNDSNTPDKCVSILGQGCRCRSCWGKMVTHVEKTEKARDEARRRAKALENSLQHLKKQKSRIVDRKDRKLEVIRQEMKAAKDKAKEASDKATKADEACRWCVACQAEPAEFIAIPCRHISYCPVCLSSGSPEQHARCPFCRADCTHEKLY